MLKYSQNPAQYSFFTTFEDQLDHEHPLYVLANKIDWDYLETYLAPSYSYTGRPSKPVRLMCGLLLLKHIRGLSDESVVEQFSENSYYQYFCGGLQFEPIFPCAASELVHFRNRIGEEGITLMMTQYLNVIETEDPETKK